MKTVPPSPRLRRRDTLRIGAGRARTFALQHPADSTTFLLPVEPELDRLDLKWMQIKLHGVALNLELRPGIFQQVRLVGSGDPGSQSDLYCWRCLASGFIDSKHGGVPWTRFQSRQHDIGMGDFQQSPATRQKAGVRRDFAREQRMIELQPGAVNLRRAPVAGVRDKRVAEGEPFADLETGVRTHTLFVAAAEAVSAEVVRSHERK